MSIVSFDFHNTLVSCDRWFELEVRTLPWEVLLELDRPPAKLPSSADVNVAYQELRAGVVARGDEIDSYDSVTHIFATLGFSADQAKIRIVVDRLMDDALGSASLVPGAAALVRDLHERGTRLAVISSAIHHDFLEAALDRFRIADCFERIVTSASSGYYKSNPEIYRSTIDVMGGDPRHCVHVGDSLRWDIESAQTVGLRTVWLDRDGVVTPWNAAPLPIPDVRLVSLTCASEAILDLIASATPAHDS